MRFCSNAAAMLLAMAALLLLTAAMASPFLSIQELGQERAYSLPGGILELFRRGETFIAVVLLVFSVAFPYAKLLGILAAVSRVSPLPLHLRRRLHGFAVTAGKFSMLDVFVAAIVIVLVKFDGLADASSRPGVVLFCLAVLLSIASGFCVSFAHVAVAQAPNMPRPAEAPSRESSPTPLLAQEKPPTMHDPSSQTAARRWLWSGLLGLALSGALFGYAWYAQRTLPITSVRVSWKPGIAIPKLRELFGQPDLYVEALTPLSSYKTPVIHDAVLGNGLNFDLPAPLALAKLEELRLWDNRDSALDTRHWKVHDPLLLDHVSQLSQVTDGERFRFELVGSPRALFRRSLALYAGIGLALCGVLMCLPALLGHLRRHVV